MRPVNGEFLQEEALLRGARPRMRAVLYPFKLEYGWGPESGTYEHTRCGGEPGQLEMEPGYHTSGSWTSPVMQAFPSHLDTVTASWEEEAGYLEVRVWLRGAAEAPEVAAAAYTRLLPGREFPLFPYFQVRVEFVSTSRSWAVETPAEADDFTAQAVDRPGETGYDSYTGEGTYPARINRLSLEGRLTLEESLILDPGEVRVDLARDFEGLKSGSHTLTLDNRGGQWLPARESFLLLGMPWEEKRLALYHGFELPGGEVEWLLIYQGVVMGWGDLTDGWRERHRATLETRDWISQALSRRVGAPSAAGERRPFMRGFYRTWAELVETVPAQVGTPVKTGSGSATLRVQGTYRGERDITLVLEAETQGEVGTATCRWSVNGGQSWRETGVLTRGAEDPVELEDGLAVYWEPGVGDDFQVGDRVTVAIQAPVYRHKVFGGPFAAITAVYLNGEETQDGISTDPATGEIVVTGRSGQVQARVVKDGTTHPVDIMEDILAEVGLQDAVHRESFDLAKSLTPEYAIGVCFENLPAGQAVREILRRTLYDLWVDFGEIKIKAYLGES
jgi:hypothetical protein